MKKKVFALCMITLLVASALYSFGYYNTFTSPLGSSVTYWKGSESAGTIYSASNHTVGGTAKVWGYDSRGTLIGSDTRSTVGGTASAFTMPNGFYRAEHDYSESTAAK